MHTLAELIYSFDMQKSKLLNSATKKSCGIALALLVSTATLKAQSDTSFVPRTLHGVKDYRTWSIGVHGGILAPSVLIGGHNDFSKSEATFGYGLYVKKQITHALGIQADFLRGSLKGNNDRNLGNGENAQQDNPYSSFKTDLNWAASLSGVLTLGNISWLHNKSVLQPYVTAGVGYMSYTPTMVPVGTTTSVRYDASGESHELFIPVGMGVKTTLSRGINLDLGYNMYFVDQGNVDGYRTGRNDKFSYGHLGLEFALGKKSKPQLSVSNPVSLMYQDLYSQNEALKAQMAAIKVPEPKPDPRVAALQDELAKMKADSDGDGVSDYFDKCPGTPAGTKVDGSGCPLPKVEPAKEPTKRVVTEEDNKVVKNVVQSLEFETGKSAIKKSSLSSLNTLAKVMNDKGYNLKLAGHTDNVGNANKNLALSKERAEAVKKYLVSRGVEPTKIETIGFGDTQPIASNSTAAGRQENRRVEFNLY